MEINYFEGNKPEWLVPKRILCFWQRAGLLEGERGSTYWCKPAQKNSISLFSFLISNCHFLFLFLFFSQYLFLCCDFLLDVTITVILPSLLCMARVSYIMLFVTGFYYFSL